MSDTYPDGGTNSTVQTYSTSPVLIGSYDLTMPLINSSTGQFIFNPTVTGSVHFQGDLTNLGIISDIQTEDIDPDKGLYFGLGSVPYGQPPSTLEQDGGSIIVDATQIEQGYSSIFLGYQTINNSAGSLIELESNIGAYIDPSTIIATSDLTLNNAGTIDFGGDDGYTAYWGNYDTDGMFTNSGTFTALDGSANSTTTIGVEYGGINNSGAVSFDVSGAATTTTTVGAIGFRNTGTWSYVVSGAEQTSNSITGGTGPYVNDGTISVSGGTLAIAEELTSDSGNTGVVQLSNGATIDLQAKGANAQAYEFSGGGSTLEVTDAPSFAGTIRGFAAGDQLELGVHGFASYNTTTGIVTVNSVDNPPLTIDFGLGYQATGFKDDNGTIIYTGAPACYLRDTMIQGPTGEVAVQDLAIGDVVITASGEQRAVRWIGRRSYGGRFLLANPGVQPIRFHAGALSSGVPRRDLLVSPEHAMFLDGLLVPARCLVNGTTITRERGMERVEYYHVELDSHDILLAEGAPSESFLDDHSRGVFHNAAEFSALYPGASEFGRFCAPRVEQGPELEAIRRRLAGQSTQAA